jgi:hypothetical protein
LLRPNVLKSIGGVLDTTLIAKAGVVDMGAPRA